MRLLVTTPLGVVVDAADVRHVRAEDETGAFGILPRHADFVTVLAISVITWKDRAGEEHHVAVRGGVLTVRDGTLVEVATREAIGEDTLGVLGLSVLQRFREEEREAEIAIALDVPVGTVKTRLNVDELIEETLSAEDRRLLEQYGSEPGYVRQAFGLFRGPLGWVMGLTFVVSLVAFLGSLAALWRMLASIEPLAAVHWGVGAVLLFQLSTFMRSFMGSHFEANRLLLEIKRLELRLVRIGERGGDDADGGN